VDVLASSNDGPVPSDDERIDRAGLDSFPASDPPPWTFGVDRRTPQAPAIAAPPQDDSDGGERFDRLRRRRLVD